MPTVSRALSRPVFACLVLTGLVLAPPGASATPVAARIPITAHDASAAPGGTASVLFDLDFRQGGAGTVISAFDFHLNYDPARLTLNLPASTDVGAALGVGSSSDYSTNLDDGSTSGTPSYNGSWLPFSFDQINPNGLVTVTFAFDVALGLTPGSDTPVELIFDYSDASLAPSDNLSATASVSVVPLPAALPLGLGAIGLLAGFVRRRHPAGADAGCA